MTEKTLVCSEKTYEELDHYRLREKIDENVPVRVESWEQFLRRHLDLNVFISPKDVEDPDEINIMEIGMLED